MINSITVKADVFSEYELLDFQDWDGYGADPISVDTIRAARSFYDRLPHLRVRPDIAPGADGTIGFEWRVAAANNQEEAIFVEVGPGYTVRATRERNGLFESWPARAAGVGAHLLLRDLFDSP